MQPTVESEGLSKRGRRALGVMAVAVVVIVAAGFAYVYPTLTSKPAPKAGPASPINAIDHFISSSAQHEVFSGTVLIAQNGKILLDKGYGWADEGKRLPNQPSTRFRIGSVTKQFTAMAILLLQEHGKLHVQDPICRYISGCPAAWNAITIQHVLTHTSGIPDYVTTFPLEQPTSPSQLIAAFEGSPLDFVPGTQFAYSSAGYAILGSIVENVSGEPYSKFIQRAILDVLHLSSTGYDQNSPSLPDHATGYKQPWVKADYVDMSVPYAAGALYSTVDDLYRWDQALFNRKFASSQSVQQMLAAQVTTCDGLGTLCTASDCDAQRINCYSYGYGWFLGHFPVGSRYVRVNWHVGMIPGFVSLNFYYPDQEITLIVLSNLDMCNCTPIRQELQVAFIQPLISAP
ncbi:MAG TPA: serine hydrolase domain-containing protein [Candidatus Dormibacteraeota bacterium]